MGVHQDLEALLALQADDDVIDGLEARLRALGPRLSELERKRKAVADHLATAQANSESDERKHRELEGRLADHKQRQERNIAHLDSVKRMREATAAMAQVEQARKILIEEESELQGLARRIADGHKAIAAHREALAVQDAEQAAEREAIAAERAQIEGTLAEARAKRTQTSARVPKSLLAKYDRIRGRRGEQALFALRGPSCGHCDTAIPLQRRNLMLGTGQIEVCEACGVLLYATT
jgi:predicted  nucleic acid-binding Zn-ribbon protein